jgi:hypothetical protein
MKSMRFKRVVKILEEALCGVGAEASSAFEKFRFGSDQIANLTNLCRFHNRICAIPRFRGGL